MPRNASENADGFRFYPWPGGDTELNRAYGAVEPMDLLSVTSIKTLAGTPFQLVNWQIANVVNVATGMRQVTKIGPRGGVKQVYVKDGEFPGEFVRRMIEGEGQQGSLDDNRSWLRSNAEEPRDVAAVRGSIVHKMIEDRLTLDVIDKDVITKRFMHQWAQEKRKVKPALIPDDINFVHNAMRQYYDMRANVPFVVVTQEPQVYNLTAGYGGSADVFMWFLGYFVQVEDHIEFKPLDHTKFGFESMEAMSAYWQAEADAGRLTLGRINEVGGTLAVGDWKTSKGVYTGHVTQTIAYMAAEFVALDGIIDTRLSDILVATSLGVVIHIRPNKWEVDLFDFDQRQDALRAFLGSLAYARFLARHKEPWGLFKYRITGSAPGTTESTEADDGGE